MLNHQPQYKLQCGCQWDVPTTVQWFDKIWHNLWKVVIYRMLRRWSFFGRCHTGGMRVSSIEGFFRRSFRSKQIKSVKIYLAWQRIKERRIIYICTESPGFTILSIHSTRTFILNLFIPLQNCSFYHHLSVGSLKVACCRVSYNTKSNFVCLL